MSTGTQRQKQKPTEEQIARRIEEHRAKNARYIFPDPVNVEVTAEDRKLAVEISSEPKDLIIRYLRSSPRLSVTAEKGKKLTYSVVPGEIRGALVAFVKNDRLYIGWSKRNESYEAIGKPVETLVSSKQRALYTACLRALKDTITMGVKQYAQTSAGNIIPASVVKNTPNFAARAIRYFKKDLYNVKLT